MSFQCCCSVLSDKIHVVPVYVNILCIVNIITYYWKFCQSHLHAPSYILFDIIYINTSSYHMTI